MLAILLMFETYNFFSTKRNNLQLICMCYFHLSPSYLELISIGCTQKMLSQFSGGQKERQTKSYLITGDYFKNMPWNGCTFTPLSHQLTSYLKINQQIFEQLLLIANHQKYSNTNMWPYIHTEKWKVEDHHTLCIQWPSIICSCMKCVKIVNSLYLYLLCNIQNACEVSHSYILPKLVSFSRFDLISLL
jgi:hypothetical protein